MSNFVLQSILVLAVGGLRSPISSKCDRKRKKFNFSKVDDLTAGLHLKKNETEAFSDNIKL